MIIRGNRVVKKKLRKAKDEKRVSARHYGEICVLHFRESGKQVQVVIATRTDSDDQDTQKKLCKRKSGTSGSNKGARIMPAKGTQETVEIILDANERGDDKMMKAWSKVEKKKMDRFEDVAMKIVAGDPELKDRVEGLLQDMGDMRADIQELKGGMQEMLLMMRAERNVQ